MERKHLKSIGLDSEEYEKESLIVIEDIKRIREMLLDTLDSKEKEILLLELLKAIDSMIKNRKIFRLGVSIDLSATPEYLTITYYEDDSIEKRIYDDVGLLPTFLIISKDLKHYYFVREENVLPNPDNRGRRSCTKIDCYQIDEGIIAHRVLEEENFVFQIEDDCLNNTQEFVSRLQKRLTEE